MQSPHYDYAIIGGDMRQVYLAEIMAQHQNSICHYALTALPDKRKYSDTVCVKAAANLEETCFHASSIICPIPLSKNNWDVFQDVLDENLSLDSLLSHLQPGQSFFAGCIPKNFSEKALEKGVILHDLMMDSTLSFYNTIATAEGAICEAISHSPINLHCSNCAVLGYGKCGSTLVHYLNGMLCHLAVFTDDDQERAKATIPAKYVGNLDDFKLHCGHFDYVFNTVPAVIVDADTLESMKSAVTIIDISSAPGGIDFAEAKQLGINARLCPGLPGKYAPASSARAIMSSIKSLRNAR